jgi:hypothetical protein
MGAWCHPASLMSSPAMDQDLMLSGRAFPLSSNDEMRHRIGGWVSQPMTIEAGRF